MSEITFKRWRGDTYACVKCGWFLDEIWWNHCPNCGVEVKT